MIDNKLLVSLHRSFRPAIFHEKNLYNILTFLLRMCIEILNVK